MCNGILTHLQEKYSVPDLHVNFAKKKRMTQLSGLSTGDGLQGMMERITYYAVGTVLPFAGAFIDRSFGFFQRCNLT